MGPASTATLRFDTWSIDFCFRQFVNGLFQKKTNKRGVEDIVFSKPPGIFRFFTLPLEFPDKKELGNSKRKIQDPSKFPIIFSWSPLEIPLRF